MSESLKADLGPAEAPASGGSGRDKREEFKARQAGNRSPDYRADGTHTRRGARNHDARMARWARNYDRLNGAPESMEDR